MLTGALIMLFCGGITAYFVFDPLLQTISIGVIVNLIAAPMLMIMMIRKRRGWE